MDIYKNSPQEAIDILNAAKGLILGSIKIAKPHIYIDPESIPDNEVLGVLAARYLLFSPYLVLGMCWAALTEANCHKEATVVANMYKDLLGVFPWEDRNGI